MKISELKTNLLAQGRGYLTEEQVDNIIGNLNIGNNYSLSVVIDNKDFEQQLMLVDYNYRNEYGVKELAINLLDKTRNIEFGTELESICRKRENVVKCNTTKFDAYKSNAILKQTIQWVRKFENLKSVKTIKYQILIYIPTIVNDRTITDAIFLREYYRKLKASMSKPNIQVKVINNTYNYK